MPNFQAWLAYFQTCVPMARITWRSQHLPPALAEHRLSTSDQLGTARFIPHAMSELLPAVFATWNLLDATMYLHEPDAPYQTGYLRELQMRRIVELARGTSARNYCEVGMNGGHSLTAMLLSNDALSAHVFDLFAWRYSVPVAKLVSTVFGSRVNFRPGDSRTTIPAFVSNLPHADWTCDLILVDGGHTAAAVRSDLRNLHALAGRDTKVVIDDIAMSGPGSVLNHLNSTGVLIIDELYGPFVGGHAHNPCMRAPDSDATRGRKRPPSGEHSLCPDWGFAIVRFAHPASASVRGGQPRLEGAHHRRQAGKVRGPSPAAQPSTLEKPENNLAGRGSWTLQTKTNCFSGNGAVDVAFGDAATDILTTVTNVESMVQACKALCLRREGCTAITVPRYFGGRRQYLGSTCFLHANVTLPLCKKDSRFDTWALSELSIRVFYLQVNHPTHTHETREFSTSTRCHKSCVSE